MNTPRAREHANTRSEFKFTEKGLLEVKDAAIIWSHFGGGGGFGRSFNLVLSDSIASRLKQDGWYVKEIEDQDGDITNIVEIAVGDKGEVYCPTIVRYSTFNGERSSTSLTFDDMNILDRGAYEKISVTIVPREKSKPDPKYGSIKGYLRTLRCIAIPSFSNSYDKEYDDWLNEEEA